MAITKEDAAEALVWARQSEQRSFELFSYARLAPFLFITGLLWLFADLALRFVPALRGWAWPAAILVALITYVALSIRNAREVAQRKIILSWLLIIVFAIAAFLVLQPGGHQIHGIMGVITGATFAALGLRHGPRLLLLGLAIGILSVFVHFTFGPGDNILIMGLVGGGGMMLGAWWLRRP